MKLLQKIKQVLTPRIKAQARLPTTAYGFDGFAQIGTQSRNQVLQLAAVYRCITLITSTIASLPFELIDTQSRKVVRTSNNRTVASVLRTMQTRPDNIRSYNEFVESFVADLILDGAAYIFIDKSNLNTLNGLYLIDNPSSVSIHRGTGNNLGYHVTINSKSMLVPANKIIRIAIRNITARYHQGVFAYGNDRGLPVHEAIRQSIRRSLHLEKYVEGFFRQGSGTDFAIESPGILTEDQKTTIRQWNELRASSSSGIKKPLVLMSGLSAKSLNNNNQDNSISSTWWENLTKEIAMAYGVPIAMIDNTTATKNVEETYSTFYRGCLMPYLKRIEAEFSLSLFPDQDYHFRFRIADLLQGDTQAIAKLAQIGLGGSQTRPFFTVNEIREMLGYSIDDNPDNDIIQKALIEKDNANE